MNIFKTLASGSGSINEPNVSAFLGYLLNPKEDHGLGDAFLRKFLKPLLKQNEQLDFMRNRDLSIRDLSIRSNFEFEVLLEQAFEDNARKTKFDESNRIVDIVILCYEKKSQQGKSLAKDIINQKKEGQDKPNHIFLIENKIKDGSVEERQLEEQYNQTIKRLAGPEFKINKPKELISVIFVTPDDLKAKKEFENFTKSDNNKTDNKCHLFWHTKKNDTSISKIIKDILKREYPPIDAYCKHTLQAFLEFIESDFQSTMIEELEKKRENPRFKYTDRDGKEDIYTRPLLAKKIIVDYIEDYKKNHHKEITFDELGSALFPRKINVATPHFVKAEEAHKWDYRKDGTLIYDNYGFYKESIKIADAEIRFCTGYNDKELQELLDKTVKLKLDDMRI